MKFTKEIILEALKRIVDPETNKDLVSSELIKNIIITEDKVDIVVELKKANSPIKNSLERVIKEVINTVVSKNLTVKVNILAPQTAQKPIKVQETAKADKMKNIILIASGKGGVGKSTVATNLSIAVSQLGYKVGLLDADIFGPSLPKMFKVENVKPLVKKMDSKDVIIPVEKYGVKMLSIGFFVESETALIWRAPMATNALMQLINDADWDDVDFLFIDLPPGTSDIQLTLVQNLEITGAVIVTTPQQVALVDAKKAIDMFANPKLKVPLLGIVENMSWFTPAELPNNKYFIFGKGGAEELVKKYNTSLLAQIPLVQSICESGDDGLPSVLNNQTIEGASFKLLAENMLKQLSIKI